MGPVIGGALALAGLLGAASSLKDLWDEGDLVGGPDWTKAGKRKLASRYGMRAGADEAVMEGGSDVVEQAMAKRLSGLQQLAGAPRAPASYMMGRDQQFMQEMSQRYRKELQSASLAEGPGLAEMAAKAGLL